MRKWLGSHWRAAFGGALTIAAIAIVLVLAFLGGAEKPPTRSTNLSLGVLAASLQIAAGWMFTGEGKADPAHAQASARRLIRLAGQVSQAKMLAESAQEQDNPRMSQVELRGRMGVLSTQLSMFEENVVDSVDDWRLVHARAVERAEGLGGSGNQ